MIHKVKLKVRDEERWLTSVSYGYHIKFSDAPDIDKIIQLHQEVALQLGSEQALPIEGGLLRLRFSSTDHDQFFYDWLFTSMMEDGSIELLQNEVETVSRISFWDCYCIGVEEWMSADGAPMGIELLLSPAILKKDAPVHEKVWKITDIHGNTEEVKGEKEPKEEKEPEITKIYWKDANGKEILNLPKQGNATLCAQTINTNEGDSIEFDIDLENGNTINISGTVDSKGVVEILNVDLSNNSK